jgi:hypothetical protein
MHKFAAFAAQLKFGGRGRLGYSSRRPANGVERAMCSARRVRSAFWKYPFAILLLGCLALFGEARAALNFVENKQELIPFNLRSFRGIPISPPPADPQGTGSDGRAPTSAQQAGDQLTTDLPSAGQFMGVSTFSGLSIPNSTNIGTAATFQAIAVNINMPRAVSNDVVTIVLRRAGAGAPFFGQQVSFLFGAIIPVPSTDENDTSLKVLGVDPVNYWLAEPYTTNGHTNSGYYWSKNALAVFANQPGPVSITWRKAAPEPSDHLADTNYVAANGRYYRLHTVPYVVSGAPAKPPQKMYWTEKRFVNSGKKIFVPAARVSDLVVAYHSTFPERVDQEWKDPNDVPLTSGSSGLQVDRTLWFEKELGMISAYNREGRVFVELLGNTKADGFSRLHVGFEIVDVFREPTPSDVTIELGEKLTAFTDGRSDAHLIPEPIANPTGNSFAYGHNPGAGGKTIFYATRETRNQNDYQVHWMSEGTAGILWPAEFARYKLVWPSDPAKYSHYLRPLVETDDQAKLTAVQLPLENAPVIEYQDPFDTPRAKVNQEFKFYTVLDEVYPAHRTLLRFNASEQIAFERIFSWLDLNVKDTNFAGSVAENLTGFDANASSQTLVGDSTLTSPRVLAQTAQVGQRLNAPNDESGSINGLNYLAGHILIGTEFSATAYVDPFATSFEEAQNGSIIPINAKNENGFLEVWWFRPNSADQTKGFKPVYWPSVIGRYTIRWPADPSEIVLASNDGSGGLSSLQAAGHVYIQNDAALPGYNPNEEHALMQGGQVFALRDDLNITTGDNYTSHPFVLLEYTDADGRPSIRPFKILREKGNVKFDYEVAAGMLLQAPMPLPLLEKPLAPVVDGFPRGSLNFERAFSTVISSASNNPTSLTLSDRPLFRNYWPLVLQDFSAHPIPTFWFFPTNLISESSEIQGLVSTNPPYEVSLWTESPQPVNSNHWKFKINTHVPWAAGDVAMLTDRILETNWTITIIEASKELGFSYIVLDFGEARPASAVAAAMLIRKATTALPSFQDFRLATDRIPENIDLATQPEAASLSSFTMKDRKAGVWVYRGPHDDQHQPYMAMQFYYKTLPGFFFPEDINHNLLALSNQPPAGTITPYLRPLNPDQTFAGDPIYGNSPEDQWGDGNPLPIYYRPVWPEGVPVLHMAETLTLPKRGLPSVRGQSSLQVLYQQSQTEQGGDLARKSAVLHDPTREKVFEFGTEDQAETLHKIPDGINTQVYRGTTYFPNLPPHLAERFFFDPNRAANGALVFKGEFVDSPVGDDYMLLNVVGVQDAAYLMGLCPDGDDKDLWDAAITNGLATIMERFIEDTSKLGTFIVGSNQTNGPAELAQVTDQDVAVDSYALTAIGPGSGYITLIAGNGLAFTEPGDPISVHIIRVVDTLYRGETKVLTSSNPLSEKVTVQQVVDLAGQAQDYEFEWKITSPVDGLPPAVYENTRQFLVGDGIWTHLQFPLATDLPATIHNTATGRLTADVQTSVQPIRDIAFESVSLNDDGKLEFDVSTHMFIAGNQVSIRDPDGLKLIGTVDGASTATSLVVAVAWGEVDPASFNVFQLSEIVSPELPQSILLREFNLAGFSIYSQFWLSLDLNSALGAKVYIDGQLVVTANLPSGNTGANSPPSTLFPLSRAYRLGPELFSAGADLGNGLIKHRIVVELFSSASPDASQNFNLRLEAFEAVDQTGLAGSLWLPMDSAKFQDGIRAILGDGADVRALADNYLIMRYRATNSTHASFDLGWSQWTEPQLVEGWIKRVLAGINPFNQRINDLFNNRVNTTASILTQAGQRWEGDVALNLDSINDYGLIEIYETILRRGKGLSIDAGINFGPANDALLLASGYLNDLYMMIGNEAWADAANPTIGIGTKDKTYGDIATALFAFKGQTASLLEEELALLRGRDDFLQPGVETAPVYNRLFWNYTRGIDSGEVIYALNYNILENNDTGVNGVIDADDARHLFPQGHGDAYGHYLTAAKGYYALLLDEDFDWVPRTEAVTILGKAVQVDYQDERKFAAAAAALARGGRQITDLQWRKDYQGDQSAGWEHLGESRDNSRRSQPSTRFWGVDHWASRTMQGAYINWMVGNAILPPIDEDPTHEGIQIVDRTTVPELAELTAIADSLQTDLDNVEAGLSPLGLAQGSLAFDINPSQVTGANGATHFEQIYQRAKLALNNALAAFDDAKDVTRLMRSEQDSLAELQTKLGEQELAYTHALIEIYGSPYPDDLGPGKTYASGYAGPDLLHFMYVDDVSFHLPGILDPTVQRNFKVDIQQHGNVVKDKTLDVNFAFKIPSLNIPLGGGTSTTIPGLNVNVKDYQFVRTRFSGYVQALRDRGDFQEGTHYVNFPLDSHGFFAKPPTWKSKRPSPGKIQEAIAKTIGAYNVLLRHLADNESDKYLLDRQIDLFDAKLNRDEIIHQWDAERAITKASIEGAQFLAKIAKLIADKHTETISSVANAAAESIPKATIIGTANGGDIAAVARGILVASAVAGKVAVDSTSILGQFLTGVYTLGKENFMRFREAYVINPMERELENKGVVLDLEKTLSALQTEFFVINQRAQEFDDAQRNYRTALAEGDRLLEEREVFRQRSAALVQGFRTRDAAFRIFRNEKLERYKTLFDLAARYSLLAANAYDYETGLLNTAEGRTFISRITGSRALGVVKNGEPQFAGSNTGDPGLSSALAEMKADWDVLKGRLGFNNPDAYGTTVSLRTEHFRILPNNDGAQNWKDVLEQGRRDNLLDDSDVRRYCMQIKRADGLAVPGLILSFETTITDGLNLFGRQRAAGDHWFSPSSFATKIFSTGVAFEGYKGMDNPVANSSAVNFAGGSSAADPPSWYLDSEALGATPYIYLVPVGVDAMRTPPLGDESSVRTWAVSDVSIPLPFNIGASDFSTKQLWQSSDSLTEDLFSIRKHQAFRPVSVTTAFSNSIYGINGQLGRSQFTNNRLIGRSVWNTKWKLIIPGQELLSDPKEGLDRFIKTVKDIKLHFVTYSYSGN